MLGIEVAQSTVAKYMDRPRRPSSQGWKTFLRNHAAGIATIDMFVVRTVSFKLLYALVILHHGRRRLVTVGGTPNPAAEWVAGQVTEGFPWNEAPRLLIRDRDRAYGHVERLIGSIRRECLDHVIVFGEAHLRGVLKATLCITTRSGPISHWTRTRRTSGAHPVGNIAAVPVLRGLHSQYVGRYVSGRYRSEKRVR